MAGPQSFVPPPVSPSRAKRRFTLEEANRTLPLISRIVADIVRVNDQAMKFHEQLESASNRSKLHGAIEKEIEKLRERMVMLIDELHAVGAELKDPRIGLIDFVGRHQNRDIFLCWKHGEPEIGHWHELDAGFPGRKPVSAMEE
jgi:hypothetical protein